MSSGGPTESARTEFLVVGLGGSAGAINSFLEFFHQVPEASGMAYVVILHLSPEHESRLAEVLQSAAKIPVTQLRETVRVEPDRIYVIPPNKSLAMVDGHLELSAITGFEQRRAPIDIFFRTLADSLESRAVSVIMSGSGSDGSIGLRRIKECNGLVVVQDPAQAPFAEMPRSAIATGLVDFVVPAAEMPRRIIAYRDQIRSIRIPEDAAQRSGDDERALTAIFTTLRKRTGQDFANYKRSTLLRRVERRLAVRGLQELSEYARLIADDAEEPAALLRELLISVTNFFRDAPVWERIEQMLIPRILENKRPEDHLRIWVAGCATGEEAYSMAILLADRQNLPNVQIFATDLDEHAIARARNGIYNEAEVADVSPERLRRYFVQERDGFRVRREIREMVVFAHHNLLTAPPFAHLDLVTCRNLLIYLNRAAQQRALEVLHFALEPGGYLLLGTAESAEAAASLFTTVDKEMHLFQSRDVPRVITPVPAREAIRTTPAPPAELRPFQTGARERLGPIDLHHRLLEQYAPPSLIVDDQHNIVHLSNRAGRYLQFSGGEATTNVLQVVRPELGVELRSALFQAGQKRASVAARNLLVHTGDGEERIDLSVRPVLREDDPARGYFLILFEEAGHAQPLLEPIAVEPAARHLEEELLRTKARMRSTIEQYEVQAEEAKASNEELQAMNEELRSTAEELETSQEELQSVNEELQTVNQELKVKIDEITHTSDDLRNLMSSTEIGTVFVDRSLRVKLFTPRAREIFNLIPADVGRSLLDLTSKVDLHGLAADMERVLGQLQTVDREVATGGGVSYLMRLLPYRTADDRIDGVVLTFVDITRRARAETALREREAQMAADLAGMRRLHELHSKLITETNLKTALDEILAVAVDFANSDRGTIQLVSHGGKQLEIVAHRGFAEDSSFINFFRSRDFAEGPDKLRRLIVEDVSVAPGLAGTEAGAAMIGDGVLAGQSTPMISRSGEVVGVLSTQHREPHRPTGQEMQLLDLVAWTAANFIERHRAAASTAEELKATRLLRDLAARPVTEATAEALYQDILSAAITLTGADAGMVQMLDRERQELFLLATRGFPEQTRRRFARVDANSKTSCGQALIASKRTFADYDVPAGHDPDGSLRAHAELGYLSGQSTPLVSRSGKPMGMLSTHWRTRRRPNDTEVRYLDLLARQAADLIEERTSREHLEHLVKQRTEELRTTARRVVESQEEERQRIARELHDEMGQHLTALQLGLEGLAGRGEDVERLKLIVSRLDETVDRLILELRPPALDDLGLHGAIGSLLDEFRRSTGLRADLHTRGMDGVRLAQPVEITLYRVLQETLTNISRHAQAKNVSVIIERQHDQIQVIVEDDGKGFDDDGARREAVRGLGLLGMRERVALIGGSLSIESGQGRGTTTYVRVPLRKS
jgi:two-component system CheB/CheR fusion protein